MLSKTIVFADKMALIRTESPASVIFLEILITSFAVIVEDDPITTDLLSFIDKVPTFKLLVSTI